MELRFKKLHEDAVIPAYAKPGDAGLDLTAIDVQLDKEILTVKTGLAVEIPFGYVGLVFPRSSVYKMDLALANCVGVIYSGYRGEIMCKFRVHFDSHVFRDPRFYKAGERCAQLIIIPYPTMEPIEVQQLSETARGESGFGSTN